MKENRVEKGAVLQELAKESSEKATDEDEEWTGSWS